MGMIKDAKSREFIYSLISSMKVHFKNSPERFKNELHAIIKGMLNDYVGYCMVTNTNPENPEKS
jgi:hypothetical protein